jgi:hypothetical protein
VKSRLPRMAGRWLVGVFLFLVLVEKVMAQGERGPIFLLEPGMLTTDFISVPVGSESGTGFNMRFETRFPSGLRWFMPVVGGSVTPYGTSNPSARGLNTPVLFAGNVFPLIDQRRTNGWVTAEVPLLVNYAFGGGGANNERLYGRDLHLQVAFRIHLGEKRLRDLGPFWRRLDVYVMFEQNLTPNEELTSGKPDRFNPVAMYGVTIPVGERKDSP